MCELTRSFPSQSTSSIYQNTIGNTIGISANQNRKGKEDVLNPNLHQSNRKYTEKSQNSTSNPTSGTTAVRARSLDQPAFSWRWSLLLAALPVPSRL
jgi:hypothetical protein